MLARHIIALSCALALLSWAWSRGWRRLPLFGLYLAAQLPLLVGYRPESAAWLSLWVWLEPVVVLMRVAATGEAFWRHSETDERVRASRGKMAVSILLLSVAAMALVWTFTPAARIANIVQARRIIHIGCCAFLMIYVLLMWCIDALASRPWQARHALIMLGLLLNHAVVAVAAIASENTLRAWTWNSWYLVNPVSSMVSAVLLGVWAVMWWKERDGRI